MKYALVNGKKTHIRDVNRGTIGNDMWYREYRVKACKGHYMQYWKYCDEKPILPEGYENETEWHAIWKRLVRDEYCEVVCGENYEHRADIKTPEHVIEIQKSPISFDAAKDRIDFYNSLTGSRVIWIVNAYSAYKNITTSLNNDKTIDITWKYPKKWVRDISGWKTTDVYLDISPTAKNMLKIWMYKGKMFGVWKGKNAFYDAYLSKYSDKTDNFSSMFNVLDPKDY